MQEEQHIRRKDPTLLSSDNKVEGDVMVPFAGWWVQSCHPTQPILAG